MAAVFDRRSPFPASESTFSDSLRFGAEIVADAPAQDFAEGFAPAFDGVLPAPQPALLFKRAFDVAGSFALLIVLLPILLAAALAVAVSGAPVLFSQPRVGLRGASFRCYKFRSMVVDAERALNSLIDADPELRAEWQQNQKLERDPRVTRVGAFLRRTSIDELPQLWNVLRGDMSLVGPRPILLSQYLLYGRSAKWYASMRPGITGLWQVTSRGDGNFKRRIALDCLYVRSYRLHHDFGILLKTVRIVLSGRGAV